MSKRWFIVRCESCGDWKLFWRRAYAAGWRWQTWCYGNAIILCAACQRELSCE